MTPFKIVYGRDPPSLLCFVDGSSNKSELEAMLKSWDAILKDAKAHLLKAREQMKNNVLKKRRDFIFEIGSLVFLMLMP